MSPAKKALIAVGLAIFAGTVTFEVAQSVRKKREERREMESFDAARRELANDMKREIDQTGSISADTAARTMEKMRGQMEKMSGKGWADDKQMKAASEVIAAIQEKSAPYLKLIKEIESDNPMDMTTVKDRADLGKRRKFGQEMLRLNRELLAFVDGVEPMLRDKALKLGVEKAAAEQFVAGFMKGFSRSAAIQRRIRMTDETMAKALVSMTDLLEAEWGKWKLEKGELIFDSNDTLARYNKMVEETAKAADEQAAAQRELVELQQRGVR